MILSKKEEDGEHKMVAKKVDLGNGLKFASIAEGRTHFDKILKATPLNQRVTSTEFNDLKLLYEAYCAKTNWPMPSPPKAFFPTHVQQKGYTTKCFGIEFESGKTDRFSLDKALTAVAN
jgi:hypothetical protein